MNMIKDDDLREIIMQNITLGEMSFNDITNGIITDIKYQICRNLFDKLSPLNDNV